MGVIDEFKSIVDRILNEMNAKYYVYMHTDKMYSIYFYVNEVPEEKIREIIERIYNETGAVPRVLNTVGKVYLDYSVSEKYLPLHWGEVKVICNKYIIFSSPGRSVIHHLTFTPDEDKRIPVPKQCIENAKPVIVVSMIGKLVEKKNTGKKLAYCEGRKRKYLVLFHEDILPPLYEVYYWDKDKVLPELEKIAEKILSYNPD